LTFAKEFAHSEQSQDSLYPEVKYLMAVSPSSIRQAAAIPIKANQLCLVTSRSGKRWVIPKGNIEPGKTAGEIALQEAWEEAGLTGVLLREPVGSYLYEKLGTVHHVIVFAMRVTDVAESWPEDTFRERNWLKADEALARIEDPGLREIIRSSPLLEKNGKRLKVK
jgi:8-oxo-dGTP pyrophosphatase MutT (NUDIX family)